MNEGAPLEIDPNLVQEIAQIPTDDQPEVSAPESPKPIETEKTDKRVVWFIDENADGLIALSGVLTELVKKNSSIDVSIKALSNADSAIRALDPKADQADSGVQALKKHYPHPDLIIIGDLYGNSQEMMRPGAFEERVRALEIPQPNIVHMRKSMLSGEYAQLISDNLPAESSQPALPKPAIEQPVETPAEKLAA